MFATERLFSTLYQIHSGLLSGHPSQALTGPYSDLPILGAYNDHKRKKSAGAQGTGSQKKDKNGKDNNNDGGRGGGLLQPIIEDVKGWIGRRR